jgi:hypothetical protein
VKVIAITAVLAATAVSSTADQARVTVRIFEMPHPTLTALLADPTATGKILHEKSLQLATERKAEIVDTAVLICRSGARSTVESIAELIYPTEPDPDYFRFSGTGIEPVQFKYKPTSRPPTPTYFETRNAGSTLTIEPTLFNRNIELLIQMEHIAREGYSTWHEYVDEWGDASIRFPIFETLEVNATLTLPSGEFQLINVFTPKPAAIPAVDIRRLVFVSATILPIPKP